MSVAPADSVSVEPSFPKEMILTSLKRLYFVLLTGMMCKSTTCTLVSVSR